MVATTDLADLEMSIREIDGVLGCVILTDEAGGVSQIEAFASSGTDHGLIQAAIKDEITARDLQGQVKKIIVMELEAESLFGDRDSLERLAQLADEQLRSRSADIAAEELTALAGIELATADSAADRDASSDTPRPRPPVSRVLLTSTSETFEAEVSLGGQAYPEVLGTASGEKVANGLKVLAEATLEAATSLVGRAEVRVLGVIVTDVIGRDCVMVLVQMPDGLEVVGSALVRDAPVSEAAVRATLDAVNRRLMRA